MAFDAFAAAFTELSEDEIKLLRQASTESVFSPGSEILVEGQLLDVIYVIVKGRLRVTHSMTLGRGGEFVTPLGPGEIIGEMSFMDGLGASATLIADGEVTVQGFGHDVAEELSTSDAEFSSRFYHSLLLVEVKRLRATNTRIPLAFA